MILDARLQISRLFPLEVMSEVNEMASTELIRITKDGKFRLKGQEHNREKELALEKSTFYALLGLIAPEFEEKEGLIQMIYSSQKQIAVWEGALTLTWFMRNNKKENFGTHVPDFVIQQSQNPLVVIECKNVNPECEIHPDWLKIHVVSRFENYGNCSKLAVFSFFQPKFEFRTMVSNMLQVNGIKPLELGVQPYTPSQVAVDTKLVKQVLSPHIRPIMKQITP